jgi:hypothetical protein
MAAQPIGRGDWPFVKDVIALFVVMGCEVRTMPATLVDETAVASRIRFLYNPAAKVFVAIDDYDDDMKMTPSEIDHFERRLDIEIPKKESWKFE